MASPLFDHHVDLSLHDLHQQQHSDSLDGIDALAMFTDTLFWDADQARFLDAADYSLNADGSLALGADANGKSYGGIGMGGGNEDDDDFFNGKQCH